MHHNVLQGSSELQSPPLGNNTVSDNVVTDCGQGIGIGACSGNTVTGNTIASSDVGLSIDSFGSLNNTIYHNNFVDNTAQVYVAAGYANTWDDGYPSGGNYWSDYADIDQYSGPYQNETGPDGIWDHPYEIDENNIDYYPIVPEFPSWTPMLLLLVVFTVAIAIHKRRLLKTPIH